MAPRNKGLGEPQDSDLYKKALIDNPMSALVTMWPSIVLPEGSPLRGFHYFTRIYEKMRKNEKSAQGIKSLGTTKIG